MLSKILTPVDLTEASPESLHQAVALAKGVGAELIILHADELPLVHGELPYLPQYVYDDQAVERRRKLDALVREAASGGAHARGLLVRGPAVERITSVAEAEQVDMIVMGTHGRRGMQHLLLGSVAEHVVRTARVPVMTVRGTCGEARPSTERL